MQKETKITFDPNRMPMPTPTRQVDFRFWIEDVVKVADLDFKGTIFACAINNTEGIVYLVDNGFVQRWYPENSLYPSFHEPKPLRQMQVNVGEDDEKTVDMNDPITTSMKAQNEVEAMRKQPPGGDDDHGADDD